MKKAIMVSVVSVLFAPCLRGDSAKELRGSEHAQNIYRSDKSLMVFRQNGSFVAQESGTIELLMVGGGGGGGKLGGLASNDRAGGGGGGGVIYKQTCDIEAGKVYNVVVGSGGFVGQDGHDSTIAELNLIAHGGGAGADCSPQNQTTGGTAGRDGASGGGATTCNTTYYEGGKAIYAAAENSGNNGGGSSHVYGAGGGGGAGAPGANNSGTAPGAGGAGKECSILRSGDYFGGGGAGYRSTYTTAGGSGGGGRVAGGVGYPGSDGQGGGGAGGQPGGSGIVIVAYAPLSAQQGDQSEDFDISGGVIVTNISREIVTKFTSDGQLTILGSGYVELLAIGGGGGGGSKNGNIGISGGGAGGLVHIAALPVRAGIYDVKVGRGGDIGVNGGDTSVFGITAFGGGSGSVGGGAPGEGGSGGGASHSEVNNFSVTNAGGVASFAAYGNVGNAGGSSSHQYGCGGGGGAGAVGKSNNGSTAPAGGGDGLPIAITGKEEYYAGGGGAWRSGYSSIGGLGGGGKTVSGTSYAGTDGLGGGGAGNAKGGDGVVIIRYTPGDSCWKTEFEGAIGGSVRTRRGYYIHTFEDDGIFTVPCNARVEVLLVGGGGGGGTNSATDTQAGGGGGGGGGVIVTNVYLLAGEHKVKVGAGGAVGQDGADTVAFDLIAYGGGAGQEANGAGTPGSRATGGGATKRNSTDTTTPMPGGLALYADVGVRGYDGGSCAHVYFTAGGGGSGGSGGDAVWGTAGAGGIGFVSGISGEDTAYGAGGRGLARASGGTEGTDGRGSGGSGNRKGGKGIVIVRYHKPKSGLLMMVR